MARYEIEPGRSTVWIEARSSLHPIHSETTGLSGVLEFDVGAEGTLDVATAAGSLSLPVERLRSGNPLQDREMRRRIDARRYPTVDGRLTSIAIVDSPGRYVADGELTFRGVTQPCRGEVALEVIAGGVLRLTGESTFDVRQFGMQPPRILLLRVEPEVTVRIEVVASIR